MPQHAYVCVCAPTDRLVFDGGAGHTEVQLAVLLDAGIDQGLHRALVLEQQEGVACAKRSEVTEAARPSQVEQYVRSCSVHLRSCYLLCFWVMLQLLRFYANSDFFFSQQPTFRREVGLALCFVRPVHKQVSKPAETGRDLI